VPGGKIRYEWKRGNGRGFHLTGEYLELSPFHRIVHVERMYLPDPTPDNHVETTFAADGAGTLMTVRMTVPDAATRAAMLATNMEPGMEASYVGLETMICRVKQRQLGWLFYVPLPTILLLAASHTIRFRRDHSDDGATRRQVRQVTATPWAEVDTSGTKCTGRPKLKDEQFSGGIVRWLKEGINNNAAFVGDTSDALGQFLAAPAHTDFIFAGEDGPHKLPEMHPSRRCYRPSSAIRLGRLAKK